jgi:hypothetical protein
MDDIDEHAMYETDRAAWLEHVAPRMASRLVAASDEQIKRDWNRMSRDYQTAVWQHLDETQRARIRALRNA